jgi:hypothetical protein
MEHGAWSHGGTRAPSPLSPHAGRPRPLNTAPTIPHPHAHLCTHTRTCASCAPQAPQAPCVCVRKCARAYRREAPALHGRARAFGARQGACRCAASLARMRPLSCESILGALSHMLSSRFCVCLGSLRAVHACLLSCAFSLFLFLFLSLFLSLSLSLSLSLTNVLQSAFPPLFLSDVMSVSLSAVWA